jgi:hypothetical protein
MFGTIRKHQKWLWAVIITLTIVSFVVFFSPDAKWGARSRGRSEYGTIDGRAVTKREYQEGYNDCRLMYYLRFNKWPENDETRARQMGQDAEERGQVRTIELAKARQEKIRVSPETVGEMAQHILGPKLKLGDFLRERMISEDFLEQLLRNEAILGQLIAVVGLPGQLVAPREVEARYREQHQEVQLEAVFFYASNQVAAVTVTETNLLKWYSNNLDLFAIPEKVTLSYVEFPRSNFLAEADKQLKAITNLDFLLEQTYLERAETYKDDKGQPLSKEAALKKIKQGECDRRAMAEAVRKANDFASFLFDRTNHSVQAFEKFATNQGWTPRVSAPFSREDGPHDLKVTAGNFAPVVFSLTNKEEAILLQPVQGEDGFYVVALKDRLPPSSPAYASIRTNVLEQYRFEEARKLARQTAMAFQTNLTAGLAKSNSFASIVTNSHLVPVQLPPLSRATQDLPGLPENVRLDDLKELAFRLPVGQATPYLTTAEGGFILYLKGKLPFDEAKVKADLPKFAAELAEQRKMVSVNQWFMKESQGAHLPQTRAAKEAAEKAEAQNPAKKK